MTLISSLASEESEVQRDKSFAQGSTTNKHLRFEPDLSDCIANAILPKVTWVVSPRDGIHPDASHLQRLCLSSPTLLGMTKKSVWGGIEMQLACSVPIIQG